MAEQINGAGNAKQDADKNSCSKEFDNFEEVREHINE